MPKEGWIEATLYMHCMDTDVVSVSTSRSLDRFESYKRNVFGLGPFRMVETFHAGARCITGWIISNQ